MRAGKKAVTHFRTVEQLIGAALVEATLETGRTHQIRVHFADAGFPILGDALYAPRRKTEAIGRQALHSWKLAFTHPATGKRVSFTAEPAADFEAALAQLRRKAPSSR